MMLILLVNSAAPQTAVGECRWWLNPNAQHELALSGDQVAAMEARFRLTLTHRLHLRQQLDAASAELTRALAQNALSDTLFETLINRVEDLRRQRNVARTQLIVALHFLLTPAQRARFPGLVERGTIGVPPHCAWARGVSYGEPVIATPSAVALPSVFFTKPDTGHHPAITIRHIRLEAAPSIQGSPSVILKFDLRNDTDATVTDIVVAVSVLGPVGALGPRPVLVPPFAIRIKRPLPARYSLDYQIQLRNVSLGSGCVPKIHVVDAGRIVDDVF